MKSVKSLYRAQSCDIGGLDQSCRRYSVKKRRKGNPSSSAPNALSKIRQNKLASKQPLAEISKALSSPSVKNEIFGKLLEFQKDVQKVLMPQFLKDGPSFAQRERQAVVMDSKWWCWNIAMACTPGVMIALVCRCYKSDMEEFYQKQNQIDSRKEESDDFENERNATKEEEEGNNSSIEANSMWNFQASSVWRAISELLDHQQIINVKQDDAEMDRKSVYEHDDSNDKTVPFLQTIPAENSNVDLSVAQTSQSEPSPNYLMTRIEALENQIEEMKKTNNVKTTGRSPRSNIQNRRDADRLRKRQTEKEADNDTTPAKRSTRSMDMLKLVISNNLKEKGDAALKAGQEFRRIVEGQYRITPTTKEENSADALDHEENSADAVISIETPFRSSDEKSWNQDLIIEEHELSSDVDEEMNTKEKAGMKSRWFQRLNLFGSRNKHDRSNAD